MSDTTHILQQQLRKLLSCNDWPEIMVAETTGSTSDDLRCAAEAGGAAGCIMIADEQTGGRGTHGRSWHAPRGGVWLSLLIHTDSREATMIGMLLATSVRSALACAGVEGLAIKWPNDILLNNRKCGGILVERWQEEGANTVVGLGLNLNMKKEELPSCLREGATTVSHETGHTFDRGEIIAAVLRDFQLHRAELSRHGDKKLLEEFNRHLAWRGEKIEFETPAATFPAVIDSLGEKGEICLQDENGRLSTHNSGRILRRLGVQLLVALVSCLVMVSPLRADILHLKGGGTMEGKVTEVEGGLQIEMDSARLTIKSSRVVRWEKKLLPEEAYEKRLQQMDREDPDAQFVMALWCREHGLDKKGAEHFAALFRLDPDHQDGRRLAGYTYYDNEWITREEKMRRQGFLLYDGRWIPRQKAEKKIAQDQHRQESQRIFREGRKLLKEARKLDDPISLRILAGRLVSMGPMVVPVLRLGTTDYNTDTRAVAIAALGQFDDRDAAEILLTRLRLEGNPRLQKGIAEGLSMHPDRTYILRQLVTRMIETGSQSTRLRLAYAMQIIGDNRVIPPLLEEAAYNPAKSENVPEDEGEVDKASLLTPELLAQMPEEVRKRIIENPELLNKETTDQGVKAPEYYPIADILAVLTGREFGKDVNAWKAWWSGAAEDFYFDTPLPPALANKQSDSQKEDPFSKGLSLRDYMLGRDN